ncbi:hypothetical protein PM082_006133 [Marasmius tenuissimus]|nr:hypothetical protein PM082_006133 [Marasmius tenuissimus]
MVAATFTHLLRLPVREPVRGFTDAGGLAGFELTGPDSGSDFRYNRQELRTLYRRPQDRTHHPPGREPSLFPVVVDSTKLVPAVRTSPSSAGNYSNENRSSIIRR